jgi:molybdopterin-guanine dinucleotide biosynthesis protein A
MGAGSVILAGGKASRMGGADKAFVKLAGMPLLPHVIARLAPQVSDIVISVNGDLSRFASFGLPVIADPMGMGEDLEPVFACERNQSHCRVPRRR